jgi:trk system potassium uptake protein TrkH
LITENASFEVILFEVVSAFGTVGLSLGLTSKLTYLGKVVIIITMFIGRVGPLTLAFAFLQKSNKNSLHYPEEKIIVG